jgi:hypothetical protein
MTTSFLNPTTVTPKSELFTRPHKCATFTTKVMTYATHAIHALSEALQSQKGELGLHYVVGFFTQDTLTNVPNCHCALI